jgi:hypothetical protein
MILKTATSQELLIPSSPSLDMTRLKFSAADKRMESREETAWEENREKYPLSFEI